MLTERICFLGAGAMAEAIIAGLLEQRLTTPHYVDVVNRQNTQRLTQLQRQYGIRPSRNGATALAQADVVLLAVKPKDVQAALATWGPYLQADRHLLVSVVAGVASSYLESFLSEGIPVVRTMPNTSSTIGQSATGMAPGRWAGHQHLRLAEQLFAAIGSVVTVEESLMDAVTGLSGSGPAYVYYMVEAMEQAGMEAGLDARTARALTVQTLRGAAEMLVKTKEDPAALREKVTSPGGTTFVGLETLRRHCFPEAVKAAVLSARDRAKELGQMHVR